VVIPVMWVLQAVVVGGPGRRERRCSPRGQEAGTGGRGPRARTSRLPRHPRHRSAASSRGMSRSRRSSTKFPTAASIAGCRSSTVRGASSGPSSSRPPYSTDARWQQELVSRRRPTPVDVSVFVQRNARGCKLSVGVVRQLLGNLRLLSDTPEPGWIRLLVRRLWVRVPSPEPIYLHLTPSRLRHRSDRCHS
jgi:hypothetical protein